MNYSLQESERIDKMRKDFRHIEHRVIHGFIGEKEVFVAFKYLLLLTANRSQKRLTFLTKGANLIRESLRKSKLIIRIILIKVDSAVKNARRNLN